MAGATGALAPAMLKPRGREYLFPAINKNSANAQAYSHKMFASAMLKSFRPLWRREP